MSRFRARFRCRAQVPVPCKIVNISDGGAMLTFDKPIRLPATCRLVVEDTSFNLMCKVRHQTGTRAGVRFARIAEGAALNRHFLRAPAEPAAGAIPLQPARQIKVPLPAGNRDLRRWFMGTPAELADHATVADAKPAIDGLPANAATLAALSALATTRIDRTHTASL